ncbi:hypothetical protein VNO80_19319 [Phaseolus coccineus]|uniref:Uncharacterized protein n=1 Tax=Phaseolus coccineus TaxID=3886 RepID=A0AAN9MFX0_PHACN
MPYRCWKRLGESDRWSKDALVIPCSVAGCCDGSTVSKLVCNIPKSLFSIFARNEPSRHDRRWFLEW